jgi:hypothetical protein
MLLLLCLLLAVSLCPLAAAASVKPAGTLLLHCRQPAYCLWLIDCSSPCCTCLRKLLSMLLLQLPLRELP